MNLEEAGLISRRHEDTYNHDFEHYHDLYSDDCVVYRPVQGTTHDRATMYALEQRATAACPDRRTRVLRVFAGERASMGMEELWEERTQGAMQLLGLPAAASQSMLSRSARSATGSSRG